MHVITFNNVYKTFQEKHRTIEAVRDVSLNVKKDTIHGIIGHSGAGKSTLVRLINQLEKHDQGTLEVFDYTDIRRLNKESMRMLRKRIGMVFQHFNLLQSKTVYENVLFPISATGKVTESDRQRAEQLIEDVGLKGNENTYPTKLSGGMKQRVGIARALINDPAILLCDEPTSALDVDTTKHILDLIRKIKENRGLTVVLVTHDMHVIKEVCDAVSVMHDGIVVDDGTLDDILFAATHPITKRLTESIGFNMERIASDYSELPNLTLLRFQGEVTSQKILSTIIKKTGASINILFANITPSKEGLMLISIESSDPEAIKAHLRAKGVEILNDRY